MKKSIFVAFAVSAMLAGPTLAAPGNGQGNAYGQDKVCVVTVHTPEEALGGANADVVKAEYLPKPAADNRVAHSDGSVRIFTYGDDTEATCTALDNHTI
jgi:hypothetical protein